MVLSDAIFAVMCDLRVLCSCKVVVAKCGMVVGHFSRYSNRTLEFGPITCQYLRVHFKYSEYDVENL